MLSSPAPVLEWDVIDRTNHSCSIDVKLAVTSDSEISKMSLVPRTEDVTLNLTTSPIECDEHWVRDEVIHWMWRETPKEIGFTLTMTWAENETEPSAPLLDVAWEQIADGERTLWTLGTINLPGQPIFDINNLDQQETTGLRQAAVLDENRTQVKLTIDQIEDGSFVKWTEYIPEGCVCEVENAAGASLRNSANSQVFLWFQTNSKTKMLSPSYVLTCPHGSSDLHFDGELEVAFGTRTKTSHIAETVWVGEDLTLNETMRLNQPSDDQSVANSIKPIEPTVAAAQPNANVAFAVQLMANHRDLSQDEACALLAYDGQLHTYRHEGWHKHLTDEVSTYSEARNLRSHVWETTIAKDAFVTASLEGERITVQEALLVSNQTWIP